jgi:hypothetical protein
LEWALTAQHRQDKTDSNLSWVPTPAHLFMRREQRYSATDRSSLAARQKIKMSQRWLDQRDGLADVQRRFCIGNLPRHRSSHNQVLLAWIPGAWSIFQCPGCFVHGQLLVWRVLQAPGSRPDPFACQICRWPAIPRSPLPGPIFGFSRMCLVIQESGAAGLSDDCM